MRNLVVRLLCKDQHDAEHLNLLFIRVLCHVTTLGIICIAGGDYLNSDDRQHLACLGFRDVVFANRGIKTYNPVQLQAIPDVCSASSNIQPVKGFLLMTLPRW